jgi:formylglycine-generating enzyme required for sulfatase activity
MLRWCRWGNYKTRRALYGIYDLAGNVWEWVSDWYDPDYYATSPLRNPAGPDTGKYKVLRGVRGTSLQGTCDLRVGTLTYHQPQTMTRLRIGTSTVGSGMRRVRRTLFPGHAGSY